MQKRCNDAGFDVVAVSADTAVKAAADIAEYGWSFPVGCDLDQATMHALGLYVSDPLTADETDRRFAEPAVFCLRPDGTVQIAAISNEPSARPDLEALLDGMIFSIENEKPARGMAQPYVCLKTAKFIAVVQLIASLAERSVFCRYRPIANNRSLPPG